MVQFMLKYILSNPSIPHWPPLHPSAVAVLESGTVLIHQDLQVFIVKNTPIDPPDRPVG